MRWGYNLEARPDGAGNRPELNTITLTMKNLSGFWNRAAHRHALRREGSPETIAADARL